MEVVLEVHWKLRLNDSKAQVRNIRFFKMYHFFFVLRMIEKHSTCGPAIRLWVFALNMQIGI